MERQVILFQNPGTNVYTVQVPSLPGVVTEGEGIEQALKNARDAIECHLQALEALGEEIPEEFPTPLFVSTVHLPARV